MTAKWILKQPDDHFVSRTSVLGYSLYVLCHFACYLILYPAAFAISWSYKPSKVNQLHQLNNSSLPYFISRFFYSPQISHKRQAASSSIGELDSEGEAEETGWKCVSMYSWHCIHFVNPHSIVETVSLICPALPYPSLLRDKASEQVERGEHTESGVEDSI